MGAMEVREIKAIILGQVQAAQRPGIYSSCLSESMLIGILRDCFPAKSRTMCSHSNLEKAKHPDMRIMYPAYERQSRIEVRGWPKSESTRYEVVGNIMIDAVMTTSMALCTHSILRPPSSRRQSPVGVSTESHRPCRSRRGRGETCLAAKYLWCFALCSALKITGGHLQQRRVGLLWA